MDIRPVTPHDFDGVSDACMAAFNTTVAPMLDAEGVATFRKIAAASAFAERATQDNVILVAENSGQIIGVIELKQGRHVAMLFVAPEQQNKGVGRHLAVEALKHARQLQVTVSASLPSVDAYRGYGFHCSGDAAQSAGLHYQPMAITVPLAPEHL